jgi:hypothetical protein
MKSFKKFVDENSMRKRQKITQMQHYWDDLDHMASDDTKKKNLQMRFGIRNIKLDPRNKGKILSFDEEINLPIEVGDIVLGGKFKNRRIEVKEIGENEKGDITINGKSILRIRVTDEKADDADK